MGRLKTAGTAAFLALGGFLFGYDSGIIPSSIAQPHFIDYMGNPFSAERGGIVSSFTGDAVNVTMIISGRFIAGFPFGPTIATAEDWGKLSGLLQLMLSWGFFVAQWLGYGCFQVVPGIIIGCGIWFLAETPDGKVVLSSPHGTGPTDQFLDLEYREIVDTITAEKQYAAWSWKDMISRSHRNYYGPQIYEMLGIEIGTLLKIIGILGSLSIVYCAISLWLLDKVGRIQPSSFSPSAWHLPFYFVFSFFFTMIGIISWVYPAEIFPAEICTRGNSLLTVTNWSLNLVFAQCAPIALLENLGFPFLYFPFAWNLIAAVCYFSDSRADGSAI
ncbi:hypothetical protein BDW59DRAFT_180409 [Aspergillus cavernicola]|uniref:Major facilitator superfamily (MFS) profile domain-containing protein n=1 Tax=Aspergillus cavernicola TaxID=176166 RepID=A0ABR4IAZ9_9EURO